MSDELNLRPARPLPLEIRDRIRQRVDEGIRNENSSRLRRGKLVPLLAAAATVTGLAAGVALIGGPGQLPMAEPNAELDRCWQAIVHDGKAAEYPDRKTWRLVSSDSGITDPADKLLAIRANGDPLFCGLTTTTVTVSPPQLPDRSGPDGVLPVLELPNGMIGGISGDHSALGIWVGSEGSDSVRTSNSRRAAVRDGLFVYGIAAQQGKVEYRLVDPESIRTDPDPELGPRLPRPFAPAIRFVDRPGHVAERTSPRAKRLQTCLADLQFPGRDSWAAGAEATAGPGKHVVARRGNDAALCVRDAGGSVYFVPDVHLDVADDQTPVVWHGVEMASGVLKSTVILWGTVDDAVAKLEITDRSGHRYRADLHNETFATNFRPHEILDEWLKITPPQAKAYDAAGKLIWSGRLKTP